MNYSHGERLALTKTIEDLITDESELFLLENIRKILDVDDVFLIKARDLNDELRLAIIDNMTVAKKKSFFDLIVNGFCDSNVIQSSETITFKRLLKSLAIETEKV